MEYKKEDMILKNNLDHTLFAWSKQKGISPLSIDRAKGVYLFDQEGNKIIDFSSGLMNVNIGHGDQRVTNAVVKQMEKVSYVTPGAITKARGELGKKLSEICPGDLNKSFFTVCGASAIENAIKLARLYTGRYKILTRYRSYHGSTIGGVSLSGMKMMHSQGGPFLSKIEHIGQPYWFGSDRELSSNDFGLKMAGLLEEKINEIGAENVAAFVGEPIQGAGGVIIPPETYWPEIQRICSQYGILLVTDEVICGFGRLGQWFGADYYQVQPDLMTFAKGVTSGYLPLGGVMVGDRVGDVLIDKGGEFTHGYSYSGHPATCAVAIANIKFIQSEKLIENVAQDIGPYLRKKWHSLADHPLDGETRIAGLMGALELVADKTSLERFDKKIGVGTICRDVCVNNGLVMRAVGDIMIIAPPLIITREQIDELMEKAWKCLDLTQKAIDT